MSSAQGSSSGGREENSDGSPEDNNHSHNDCSKVCSVSAGGARAKVRQHFCNIGSNSTEHVKVNNTSAIHNGSPSDSQKLCSAVNGASPSSSSADDCYMRNNVDCHRTVDKCPSKVRGEVDRRWRFGEDDSSSGNEGDEGVSGDDCCIYTYKGDQFADLPSSFLRLDRIANGLEHPAEPEPGLEGGDENERSNAGSSPEMDFLEMDFDPGPSLEQEDEEGEHNVSPLPELPNEDNEENDLSAENNVNRESELSNVSQRLENDFRISHSAASSPNLQEPKPGPSQVALPVDPVPSTSRGGEHQAPRTVCWPARDSWGHHFSSGDLCSPGDPSEMEPMETLTLWAAGNLKIQGEASPDTRKYNLHSALYHCIMAKRLLMDKKGSLPEDPGCATPLNGLREAGQVDSVMIWSEHEACQKQVTQISTSACGATATINVLLALHSTPFLVDRVKEGVATRLRAELAPLPQYLFSRSIAGATHEDVIRGMHFASDGTVFARFFHMYPERDICLSRFLSYWMKKGAVPIITLNLQRGVAPGNPIPDAWHHQMVFGVSARGVFLTNPLECVQEAALWLQLTSPSVLMVKRSDVISRFNNTTDLRPLMCHHDTRWKTMNVLGQVVNMIRESNTQRVQWSPLTQHITIPAAYKSGITLALFKDSPAYEELANSPELPLCARAHTFN